MCTRIVLMAALVSSGLTAQDDVQWVPIDPGYEEIERRDYYGDPVRYGETLPEEDVADPNVDAWGRPRNQYNQQEVEPPAEQQDLSEEWQKALQPVINALD